MQTIRTEPLLHHQPQLIFAILMKMPICTETHHHANDHHDEKHQYQQLH